MAGVACARAQPAWALALAAAGLLVSARAAARFVLWLYAAFLRPAKPLRRRYGAWAVVTGATDGIGRALAFRLAAAGLGLVLVGRSADKLVAVSADVRARHPGAQVRTFVLDFAAEGLAAKVGALKEFLRGLDVGVLVNNAGACYPYARYFHEVDEALARNLVRLNVESLTRVTHAVLPGMVERGRGAVVNIGSGASCILPSDPLYTVYAATKEYVDQFSRCLYVEYRSKGIDVQCQVPMYVATKMASIRNPTFFAPSPETYAHAAVRYIGYEPRCTPYWPHALLWLFVSLLPEPVVDRMLLNMFLGVRAKGMAKEARKKTR
ncbi:very-long-chain 3-oxoacyl-CoA reductase 1-like [Phragmites australis]|uniref:very-long-chain 3-oxoacyl-CoA reductase 1-like n=1 Tax=Phragmites australis TaxID=29695 RepID=UPI002D78EF23|nr:very-long-chain 3-oxoacyl-CoA reductase 1-like [Phragmites australis]